MLALRSWSVLSPINGYVLNGLLKAVGTESPVLSATSSSWWPNVLMVGAMNLSLGLGGKKGTRDVSDCIS